MDKLDGDQVFALCVVVVLAIVLVVYIVINAYLRARGLALLV